MATLAAAVGLSVLSAIGYALAAITQERSAGSRSRRGFLLAVALNSAGAVLHVVALRYGSLAVVQPLGALTLVFALPLGALLAGRRTTGREWQGAFATMAGLGVLLAALDTGAPTDSLSDGEALALIGVSLALIGALCLGYRRGGLLVAVASGIAFAVSSVLTQTLMVRQGVTWMGVVLLAGVGAFGLGGLLLSQIAYRFGLTGPLVVLTIANPVTAAGIGIALLSAGTGLTSGNVVAGLLAAGVTGVGVLLLVAPAPTAGFTLSAERHGAVPVTVD